jgi:hypothetical protein
MTCPGTVLKLELGFEALDGHGLDGQKVEKNRVRSELVARRDQLALVPAAVWTWSWICTRLVVLPHMAGP